MNGDSSENCTHGTHQKKRYTYKKKELTSHYSHEIWPAGRIDSRRVNPLSSRSRSTPYIKPLLPSKYPQKLVVRPSFQYKITNVSWNVQAIETILNILNYHYTSIYLPPALTSSKSSSHSQRRLAHLRPSRRPHGSQNRPEQPMEKPKDLNIWKLIIYP